MGKSLLISVILHLVFFALLIWSQQIRLKKLQLEIPQLSPVGVVYTELLYKPTNTAMKKGDEKRDLPPPQIKTEKREENQGPTLVKQKTPPPKNKPTKEDKTRRDAQALMDKLRREEGKIAQKAPKEDNFPTHKEGETDGRGTGGSSRIQASPAQMALQGAIRKYFELPRASELRRQNPNARGYHVISVLGVGNTLQLREIEMLQSSGFAILDRSCEVAIREALKKEIFAPDVISELSGKRHNIECQF
jgi:hypothetical protein